MKNLLNNCEVVRVSNDGVGTASATPTKGTIIDMFGFESVMFVAAMADVVNLSEVDLKAAGADEDDTAEMVLFTGTAGGVADATSFDNKLVVLDLVRPGKRYIEAQLFHVDQNAPFDGIFAIKYNPLHKPTTQGATVAASATLAVPADAA